MCFSALNLSAKRETILMHVCVISNYILLQKTIFSNKLRAATCVLQVVDFQPFAKRDQTPPLNSINIR